MSSVRSRGGLEADVPSTATPNRRLTIQHAVRPPSVRPDDPLGVSASRIWLVRTPHRGLRILARPGHPDFLDLPWELPLDAWEDERLVEVARGVHRHVVKFVDYGGSLYALKELPHNVAGREYRLLRQMAEESLPVVDAIGVVSRTAELDNVLITRYLDFSLPYRLLFIHRRSNTGIDVEGLSSRLLDALAMLLVRLHLAGV